MRFPLLVLALFSSGTLPILLMGQDIQGTIDLYTRKHGDAFLAPLPDAFTTGMHSGMFHSAEIKKGFHIYLGASVSVAYISEAMRMYQTEIEVLNETYQVDAPTIFGENESVQVLIPGGTVYSFPAGFDLGFLPVAAPQLRIGTLAGTEALLRYFSFDLGESTGRLELMGYGVRHSINPYFPQLDWDIALALYQQQITLGDIVRANSQLFHLQMGNTHGILNYYGFVAFQNGQIDVHYTFEDALNTEEINLSLKNHQRFFGGAGLGLRLAILQLNGEVNVGQQFIVSGGLGICF